MFLFIYSFVSWPLPQLLRVVTILFRGTTVAYIRTPTEIAVAADSKSIAAENASIVGTFCKIRQIEETNLFVAIAGLGPCCGPGSDYVADIAQTYKTQQTIKATAKAFGKSIIPHLLSKLEMLRSDPRVNYSRDYEGKRALEILFFGFEDQIPILYQWEFVAVSSLAGRIQIQPTYWECPARRLCTNGMGFAPAVCTDRRGIS